MPIQYSISSLVFNDENAKNLGLQPYFYRLRSCDTNLNSNTPANRYQIQKRIQKTVRVPSSLYTMNLGSLSSYVKPGRETHNVNWNQMSDRNVPSVQRATIPTGFYTSMNSRKHSVTSSKPGCQTPGGVGCDIKHNSYDRYLNRIKARAPLRRGIIPPTFGSPIIPYNLAYPIYGGKIIKTNIVSGCYCGENDARLYFNPLYQSMPEGKCGFNIGDYVWTPYKDGNVYKGEIISIVDDIHHPEGVYEVKILDISDNPTDYYLCEQLTPYFPCNCVYTDTNPEVPI